MQKQVKVKIREFHTIAANARTGEVLAELKTSRKPDPVKLTLDVQRKAKQLMPVEVSSTVTIKTYAMPTDDFIRFADLIDVSDDTADAPPAGVLDDSDPEFVEPEPVSTPTKKKKKTV